MKSLLFTLMILLVSNASAMSSGYIEMTAYNLENLFDTEHEEGKNDLYYLPKDHPAFLAYCKNPPKDDHYAKRNCEKPADWTEQKLNIKLDQIKKVFDQRASDTRSSYPDIAAFTEVENKTVMAMLQKKLNYDHFVITDGPDHRGIDVAVMWKKNSHLKFVGHREYIVNSTNRPTRPILEVEFSVSGQALYVYVNHWPSQGAPSSERMKMARKLIQTIQARKLFNPKASFVVTGDFNVIDSDHPNPISSVVLGELKDAHTEHAKAMKADKIPQKVLPLGTYFYPPKMAWNLLDRFFVSKNLFSKRSQLQIDLESYDIYTPQLITKTFTYNRDTDYLKGSKVTGVPKRYSHRADSAERAGFSDHFPVYIRLKY